jgi:MFS family permease
MSGPIEQAIHIQHGRFGLFFSVFLWTYGLASPIAGYVADRLGRKRVIVASLLIWSAATTLTGLVRTFEQMIAVRFLMGLSEAFYMPAAVAMVVDFHAGRTRSRATGLHLSGVYAGSVLGGFGGAIATHFGWRTGFLFFGCIGVIYSCILMLCLKPAPNVISAPNKTAARGLAAIQFAALSVLLLFCANAVHGAATWTVRNWLPTFFNTELNVDTSRAGIYGAMAFNLAAFIGMLVAGTLSDRFSRRSPRTRVIVPALAACLAVPLLFGMGLTSLVWFAVAAVMVTGMAQGALDSNLMPALCTVVPERLRSTSYGLLNLAGTIAGGVMTYVAGRLKDAHVSFGTTFQFASGFLLLAAILLLLVRPAKSLTPSPA